jgi:hypothetical protein
MDPERYLTYGLALVLLIVAWRRPGNHLKARHIKGNVVVGDSSGTINQTYNSPTADSESTPDRIGWAIGIAGLLIAAAQLAHDLYK